MEDKDILKTLADNPLLFDTLKSFLLKRFTVDYKDFSDMVSNEHIGQVVRGNQYGQQGIEEAFKEIAALRSTKPLPEESNPGR